MRYVIAAIFVAGALVPRASWAQVADTALPVAAPASNDAVGQAFGSTLKSAWTRQGVSEADQGTTWEKIKAVLASSAFSTDNWMRLAALLGVPTGTTVVKQGSYGGAGAGGSITCVDFQFRRDPDGNYYIPAINMKGPSLYKYGDTVWSASSKGITYNTGNAMGAFKISAWAGNAGLSDKQRYAPAYWGSSTASDKAIVATRPAYYNGTTLVPLGRITLTVSVNSVAWTSVSAGGPPTGWQAGGPVCVGAGAAHWNQACVDGPNDYNTPSEAAVPGAELNTWLKAGAGDLGLCPIDPEIIRAIADRAFQTAANQPGYNGAPYKRVETEDVKQGSTAPTVNDMQNKTLPTTPQQGTTPTTTPTPTPTDTATAGPDYTDPNVQAPSPTSPTAQSIVDKAFDWGFPAITINIPSGTCPTYSADFFGHQLVLDSHCPFIETNRALISAMMLLLFTIAAGIIVLRA